MRNGVAYLISGTVGQKYRKRRYPGNKAAVCHAGGQSHGILFRNAGTKKPAGVLAAKKAGQCRSSHIRIKNYHLREISGNFYKAFSKGFPLRDFITFHC
jgi:cysteine sulfinate desulfinase/cysteine desulfurase-like protein